MRITSRYGTLISPFLSFSVGIESPPVMIAARTTRHGQRKAPEGGPSSVILITDVAAHGP